MHPEKDHRRDVIQGTSNGRASAASVHRREACDVCPASCLRFRGSLLTVAGLIVGQRRSVVITDGVGRVPTKIAARSRPRSSCCKERRRSQPKTFPPPRVCLTEAYQAYQSPKILYYLGALRAAEQATVEAQDPCGGFLADTTVEATEPLRQEAQSCSPSPAAVKPGGRHRVAPRGATVLLDGKTVGALPLPLPLLLASGIRSRCSQGNGRAVEASGRVRRRGFSKLRFKAVGSSWRPSRQIIYRRQLSGAGASGPLRATAARSGAPSEPGTAAYRQRRLSYARPRLKARLSGGCSLPRSLAGEVWRRLHPHRQGRLRPGIQNLNLDLASHLRDPVAVAGAAQSPVLAMDAVTTPPATKLAPPPWLLMPRSTERGRRGFRISSEPPDAEVLMDGKSVGRTPLKDGLCRQLQLEVVRPGLHAEPQWSTSDLPEPSHLSFNLLARWASRRISANRSLRRKPKVLLQRPRWRLVGGAALVWGCCLSGWARALSRWTSTAFIRPQIPTVCHRPTARRRKCSIQAPGLGLTHLRCCSVVGGWCCSFYRRASAASGQVHQSSPRLHLPLPRAPASAAYESPPQ